MNKDSKGYLFVLACFVIAGTREMTLFNIAIMSLIAVTCFVMIMQTKN